MTHDELQQKASQAERIVISAHAIADMVDDGGPQTVNIVGGISDLLERASELLEEVTTELRRQHPPGGGDAG